MSDWRIVDDLQTLPADHRQVLEFADNPFLSYSFLSGLEKYGCVDGLYWKPSHIIIEDKSRLVGFLPLYIKLDSYGEFVFDWAWADAYQRAGRKYYPKLVSAIPFTPVTCSRLLCGKMVDKTKIQRHLISAAIGLMKKGNFSSLHVLFPDKSDREMLIEHRGLQRVTYQYHWVNENYRDFQDFLDSLVSKKRKQIARERREVRKNGIDIECLKGGEISPQQWEVFYHFYCSTFYKRWNEPRLTLEFFRAIGRELPDNVLLFLAKKEGKYIAGVFAMQDSETLYGRHWGCIEEIPFLHFELCYYQTIEYAIRHKLKKLDAGVQGEHKLARGFKPVPMPSSHWLREPGFHEVIADHLKREGDAMRQHIGILTQHLPYKSRDSGKED